jgi:hypothetical protein
LWFATDGGGVTRFDGRNWTNFNTADGLADNHVLALAQSADGTLWFATEAGANRLQRPVRSFAQTLISSTPPALFGSDRFFFELRRGEFGTIQQPLVSYALLPGDQAPNESDWVDFADINGFEITGLQNGLWTVYARAIDRYGTVDTTPTINTFTVDITPPTVLIAQPRNATPVSGQVQIQGSAFDRSPIPDLESVTL